MNPRPRPAFALAVATALVGAAAPSVPAGADESTDVVERCFTEALTAEQVEAGAVSEIECLDVPVDDVARLATPLAILYETSNTTGAELWVNGSTCTGVSVDLGGTSWDNRVSATDLFVCGNAKHFTGANYTGNTQLKSPQGYHTFTGAWNNVTSSVQYAP